MRIHVHSTCSGDEASMEATVIFVSMGLGEGVLSVMMHVCM